MFQIEMNELFEPIITQPGRGNWNIVRRGFVNIVSGFDGEGEITIQFYSDYKLCYILMTYITVGDEPTTWVDNWTSESWGLPSEFEERINQGLLLLTGQNPDDDADTWPYQEAKYDLYISRG